MKPLVLFVGLLLLVPVSYSVEPETLDIGVFPRRNITPTFQMFSPLEKYLSEQLNLKTKLHTFKDFSSFSEALFQRKFDLVHLNHFLYMQSREKLGYKVIAMNEEFGSSSLSGAIFVRADSDIDSIDDLRNKKIIFGGSRGAFISYVVNSYLLQKHGLEKGEYEEEFAINPPNAVLSVYYKAADAGGAGSAALQLPIVKKYMDTAEVKVLAQSKPFPHLPWALSSDLSPELQNKITQLLLSLNDSDKGLEILRSMKMTGIRKASSEDYLYSEVVIKQVLSE